MPRQGGPCPRHEGAICFHRHLCSDGCVEIAYERERPRVDAELRRRALAKAATPVDAAGDGSERSEENEMDIVERLSERALVAAKVLRGHGFTSDARAVEEAAAALTAWNRRSPVQVEEGVPSKLWLWRNGPQEFWAFRHLYPCTSPGGDPCTLGEPVGYAILKPSFSNDPREPETRGTTDLLASLIGADEAEKARRPASLAPNSSSPQAELVEALEEILDYRGGADNALQDEYVMDRARSALLSYQTRVKES